MQRMESQLIVRNTNGTPLLTLAPSEDNAIAGIVCGYNGSTYILLRDGTLTVHGYNAHGALGLGHFDFVDRPQISRLTHRHKVHRIRTSLSSKHALLVTTHGELYAAGCNLRHQFGRATKHNAVSRWT